MQRKVSIVHKIHNYVAMMKGGPSTRWWLNYRLLTDSVLISSRNVYNNFCCGHKCFIPVKFKPKPASIPKRYRLYVSQTGRSCLKWAWPYSGRAVHFDRRKQTTSGLEVMSNYLCRNAVEEGLWELGNPSMYFIHHKTGRREGEINEFD